MTTFAGNAKAAKFAKAVFANSSDRPAALPVVFRTEPATRESVTLFASSRRVQENAGGEKERLNVLSNRIIGAALQVHSELGPGMLESAYEACLTFELLESGLYVERQKPLPLVYRGRRLDCGYRIDLLVQNEIIVEVKSIERLDKVHGAQLLSYLRLLKLKLGLLINFNVTSLQDGIKRKVNGFPD